MRRIITYAVPGPQRKRHVCIGVDVILVLLQESVWEECLRVSPVLRVMVETPDGDMH